MSIVTDKKVVSLSAVVIQEQATATEEVRQQNIKQNEDRRKETKVHARKVIIN